MGRLVLIFCMLVSATVFFEPAAQAAVRQEDVIKKLDQVLKGQQELIEKMEEVKTAIHSIRYRMQ